MRPHLHLALVASATFAVAGTAFAQSRGVTRVGPAEPAAFWVHDDGTVEVNDAMGRAVFRDIEAYLASDAFVRNGKRCGLPAIDDRIAGPPLDDEPGGVAGAGTPSDCSCNGTDPDPVYDSVSGLTYVIPVVFHVIRNSAGTQGNISEACIQSQIESLNEDFNAIPGSPGAAGVNARIEFVLATEDPSGNPSNGITYSDNTNWFNDNGSYWNSLAWDTSEYMNVYTNTASGALGYVPALGCSNIDGQAQDRIVVLYSAIGDCATSAPYDGGRTLTHEVGHYFGLEHTFSGGCAGQGNCYNNGDLICDTLPQQSPTSGCSSSSSCGQSHQNQRNYMDYSVDSCMNSFTYEQHLRMRCILEHYRVELPCTDCAGSGPAENDECDVAIALEEGPNEATSFGATYSGVIAEASCSDVSGVAVRNDVWFTYEAPGNGTLTLSICDAIFNARMNVWPGDACPESGGLLLACSDNDCGDGPIVDLVVSSGQQLIIQVGSPGNEAGLFTLDVDFEEVVDPPANDLCTDAISVSTGGTSFTTIDASASGADLPLSCSVSSGPEIYADVWFEWTAPCTGFATIATCNAAFDSRLAVYTGGCPASGASPIACADDICGDDPSVTFLAIAGQTFRIQVGSPDVGDEGAGVLLVACEPIGGGCPEDLNDDGSVDGADLGLLLAAWATANADINDDGTTNGADLGLLLAKWGEDC
ncbi:MAG: M43 family zinc metalloprotease [Planctomycetota bacterium]|jgi:hypothetical protein